MIRISLLALTLGLMSWTPAIACTILPPVATTQPSYEEVLAEYSGEVYRNLVDTSENISIGQFKYSKKHKSHQLHISKNLKRAENFKERKKIEVTFNEVSDDRVDYIRPKRSEFSSRASTKLFYPIYWEPYIEGTYGPGDCGNALDLVKGVDYIVFADEDFTVKAAFLLTEKNRVLTAAFTHLIETPSASKGVSFSLTKLVEEGAQITLLQTSVCSPKPIYKVLGSSSSGKESEFFEAEPILVFSEKQTRSIYDLDEEETQRAEIAGLIEGKYTNAPALENCKVGRKHLSLGEIFYSRDFRTITGQMIEEESGQFNLSHTVFENAFFPETISVDAVAALLANTSK